MIDNPVNIIEISQAKESRHFHQYITDDKGNLVLAIERIGDKQILLCGDGLNESEAIDKGMLIYGEYLKQRFLGDIKE